MPACMQTNIVERTMHYIVPSASCTSLQGMIDSWHYCFVIFISKHAEAVPLFKP